MVPSKFSLKGQYALITGASGMLGIEHARALLELGAGVILTDIREDLLKTTKLHLQNLFDANSIRILAMDVSDKKSITEVHKFLFAQSINVSILINNAAIDAKVGKSTPLSELTRFESFSLDEWNKQLSVGLTGAFLCSQIYGAHMAHNGKGVIVNIASDLSVIAPDQRLYKKDHLPPENQPVKPVTYSAIKTGIVGLTRYIATYWADKGVRCNALSPGGVLADQDDEFINRVSNLIPMGRMADRGEYRSAVQFLCSDASSYMTGQNLVIDGGRSIW